MRVREVAAEAELSPAAVLYYFPDFFALAMQAVSLAGSSRASERAAVAASVPHPARRLVALVALDLPEQVDGASRMLIDLPTMTREHPELVPLIDELVTGQFDVYRSVVLDGVVSGVFAADIDANEVTRGLLALLHSAHAAHVIGLENVDTVRPWVLACLGRLLGVSLPEVATRPVGTAPSGINIPSPAGQGAEPVSPANSG